MGKTVVKGIRAEQEFFDKCDAFAKRGGIDRNKLIVKTVSSYLDTYEGFEEVTLNGDTTFICSKEGVTNNE